MKRKLLLLTFLLNLTAKTNIAQTVQACMDTVANAPNAINIWLKPDSTSNTTTQASSLQFSIAIPDTFTGTLPSGFKIDSTGWAGSTWSTLPPYNEGGFTHYNMYAEVTLNMNYVKNVDYFALKISPIGGTTKPYDVFLLCLPDGGTSALAGALFLHNGNWKSDGANLYYARPGTVAVNTFSYDNSFAIPGTGISYSRIIDPSAPLANNEIVLNAKWINDDALLNWQADLNTEDIESFTINKSIDGKVFKALKTLEITNNKSFDFLDANAKINAKNLRYLITANLKDSKTLNSNMVTLNNTQAIFTKVFPIPVSNILNIENMEPNSEIILYNNTGQVLFTQKSMDDKLKINMSSYADGIYMLKLINNLGATMLNKIAKQSQ